jgi:hypothetical protein
MPHHQKPAARLRDVARASAVAAVLATSSLVTGWGGSVAGAQAPRLAPCPTSLVRTRDFIAVYGDSASERSARIEAARREALDTFAAVAASCSGHLTVVFDPGQSVTRVLWSGTPFVPEGSPIAFQRKGYAEVTGTVDPAIARALDRALRSPAPKVATPVSAFEVLSEDRTTGPLDALVLSSFVEDDGTIDLNQPLTAATARSLADRLPRSRLAHARVAVEGVGATVDAVPAPDDWLAAVRTFASTACTATGASCTVATQVAG